ncbi:hypothetical protein MOO46_07845 (plasmid) [Apilactobacillus apisilvae]|uniref:Uncharacterized protein n=1 Tax=Apilactobacillus apisilvae TaxID=2923364 RepID=A0ABY4PJA7_9LACO|nr:hypothetical protein [Apilactobacillus apisilvae]UQS85844.1 hypothetical protein MOO46_07845 [Apilactobacillus apisilvae]
MGLTEEQMKKILVFLYEKTVKGKYENINNSEELAKYIGIDNTLTINAFMKKLFKRGLAKHPMIGSNKANNLKLTDKGIETLKSEL